MKGLCKCGAIRLFFALVVGAGFAGAGTWQEYSHNPIIVIGQTIPNMLWNDPTVIKDGSVYRMWVSGGSLTNLNQIAVTVYSGTSPDGISWNISAAPNVAPDPNPQNWDGLRIETPSVVKVGQTYHMYYSGTNNANAAQGIYAIGHATSSDGTHWTKDPANPIVTGQFTNPQQWTYQGVGEPGVVYNPADKTFYLYFTGMKYASYDPTQGLVGIFLTKSLDGSKFNTVVDTSGQPALILTQSVAYAPSGSWFGTSTPAAYISAADGKFHLFCDFLVAPQSPNNARQVSLMDAVSSDGVNYTMVEQGLFPAGQGNWYDQNVRAPALLEDNGILKMWFAGDTQVPYFASGIGYATRSN